MRRLALIMALSTLIGSAAAADEPPVIFSSGDQQVALIELFTSEGCSSCPPADRWISRLKRDPQLWRDYLPIAFHVDYWDYIGWPDRFASERWSNRQRAYAREGGVHTIYTPGLFLNGAEWRSWRGLDRPDIQSKPAGALVVEVDDSSLAVAFNGEGFPGYGDLTVHVALLGMGLSSEVAAGENRGRRLAHDFVVLEMVSKPLAKQEHRYSAELPLPESDLEAPQYALAAWVSVGGRQAPLQATGGLLPAENRVAGR